jgi:septal ring factor EnvC (AmiA/AmiB activator)
MDTSIIVAIIGTGTTFIAGVFGFIFGGRRRKAEVVGIEMDNMQKAISSWKEIVDYQTTEIITLRSEITALRSQIGKLECEIQNLTVREKKLEAEIHHECVSITKNRKSKVKDGIQ